MSDPSSKPKLQVGGTLNPRKHLFITRQDVEDQVFETLVGLEYCNILSPRQIGKSSVMIRTAERLMAQRLSRRRRRLPDVWQSSVGRGLVPGLFADTSANSCSSSWTSTPGGKVARRPRRASG